MIVSDNALSTIEIYDLFEIILSFHLFNDFLLSSLSIYQDMKNIALERTNTDLYR